MSFYILKLRAEIAFTCLWVHWIARQKNFHQILLRAPDDKLDSRLPAPPPEEAEALLKELRRWAWGVMRRLFFGNNCLRECLLFQALLRRRGIPAAIKIGVRKKEEKLEAHAWLEYQGKKFFENILPGGAPFAALKGTSG